MSILDIVHTFDPTAAAQEPGLGMLADPTRRRALLVGNTRLLWPALLAARAEDPVLGASAHPVDDYCESLVARMTATLGDARTWFSHRQYDGVYLPFQRLAVAAGLAALAPTQLLVHPTFGPWFALRAVIVYRGDPDTASLRVTKLCRCEAGCLDAFERARVAQGSDTWRTWLAVRDACPVGREFRYSESQLGYHYTKDPRFLVA